MNSSRTDGLRRPARTHVRLTPLTAAKILRRDAAREYAVSDDCILCGTCARVCPANNIVVGDTVEFSDHCEVCYACLHNCPQGAFWLTTKRSWLESVRTMSHRTEAWQSVMERSGISSLLLGCRFTPWARNRRTSGVSIRYPPPVVMPGGQESVLGGTPHRPDGTAMQGP